MRIDKKNPQHRLWNTQIIKGRTKIKDIFALQDIQHKVWINWYRTDGLIAKYSDDNLLKASGLTYQHFLVLSIMNELGETANATEMAKLLDKNTNTISTLLDRMERNGLVKKVRDTQDRRMVFAIMTPKGQKRLAVSIKASSVIFEKLAEGLSKEEMYEFNTLLEKLMKNTDKLVNPPKIVKIRKSN